MYFHIGQDFVLNTKNIIGIFDLDTAGSARRTQRLLRAASTDGAVIDACAPGTVPRSFVVLDFPENGLCLSQLSPKALKNRAETALL